jgi:hypothetical protein
MRPLAVDLFCGLGGWTEGLLSEGYRVIGFDIERHVYGDHRYPAQLVLQDVTTIDGAQFKDVDLIVASPPCQAYSYRAMPWKRAKALGPPDNTLFDACFRIQREACAAAGRHIPMVVENVRGAEKWVGRARWHYGSFYLWGDVPALMPTTVPRPKVEAHLNQRDGHGHTRHLTNPSEHIKNNGGSRFAIGSPGQKVVGQNPVDGYKSQGLNWSDREKKGQDFTRVAGEQAIDHETGRKGYTNRFADNPASQFGSKSSKRKYASAMIAKIPLPLSTHIARCWKPKEALCPNSA